MATIDDDLLKTTPSSIELVNPFGIRTLSVAIHDVDQTHTLIRNWPPVMSRCLEYGIHCGFEDDFDSHSNELMVADMVGTEPLPETDAFCVESAGMATFVQMAYAVLRALELDNVPKTISQHITPHDHNEISYAIKRIWSGAEQYIITSPVIQQFINDMTPRLFRLYVNILNTTCRDRNVADAQTNPSKWRVPGSFEFLTYLDSIGVSNYFVTGVVVEPTGGMREEINAVGIEIGPNSVVKDLIGCSSWTESKPKSQVIRCFLEQLNVDPCNALVIGDGIAEIKTGVDMGSVTISRLEQNASRRREIHHKLGTSLIIADFTDPLLYRILQ